MTTSDVVFTFQSVLDPKVNSTIASNYDTLAQVSAPDERTVKFGLNYPYAPFEQRLLLGIVPHKAFDGRDINTAPFNTAPISSGPYTVTEWRKGDRIVLKANEKYWGGAPAVTTATVVFVTDDNARATRGRQALPQWRAGPAADPVPVRGQPAQGTGRGQRQCSREAGH